MAVVLVVDIPTGRPTLCATRQQLAWTISVRSRDAIRQFSSAASSLARPSTNQRDGCRCAL